MAKAKSPVPEGFHTITTQMTLQHAAQTIEWYKKALGAQEKMRSMGPGGKVMHAELRIGDSLIMVNDDIAGTAPKTSGAMSLWLYVDDADALFNRAVAAGAKVDNSPMGPMQDQFWGDRAGTITDPEGYRWTIATRKEDLTPDEIQKRMNEFMKNFAPQPTR